VKAAKVRLPVRIVFPSRRQGMARFSRRHREAALAGADFLRLQQLKERIAPHLPEHVDLSFTSFSHGGRLWNFETWLMLQRPAVFILTKDMGYNLTREQIERLKRRAIAVGIDHKDGDLSRIDLAPFDFHISASLSGLRALEQALADRPALAARGVFAGLLLQGPDTRLDALTPSSTGGFAPVYLGLPENAEIPRGILAEIATFTVLYNRDMLEVIRRLGAYNFHFGVRPDPGPALLRSYKPFTKGLTAAACRANILANRQVDDAVDVLTEDYPYLVASNAHADIEEGYRKAREEFGGPEWRRGLDILRAALDCVSGPATAAQFVHIVTQAADGAGEHLRRGA
jgi:hypothetical protein